MQKSRRNQWLIILKVETHKMQYELKMKRETRVSTFFIKNAFDGSVSKIVPT